MPQVAKKAPDCASEIAKYDWDINMATAVSMAESSLIASRVGDTTIQYYQDGILYGASYGCFQVRYLPGRPEPKQLLDAAFNVQYAYNMQKVQGWNPWSVYLNGKYKEFL